MYNKDGKPRKMNSNALVKTIEHKLGIGNVMTNPVTGRNIRSDCSLKTLRTLMGK